MAACFRALAAQPVYRRRLAAAAGQPELDAVSIERLCLLTFLHDVGKLNAGFQLKPLPERPSHPWVPAGHIGEALCLFDATRSPARDVLQALGLEDAMDAWGPSVWPLLIAAVSHHGRPAPQNSGVKSNEIWQAHAGYDPAAAAGEFGAFARAAFPRAFGAGSALPDAPALQHLFAGMVALADQIGSRADMFVFPVAGSRDYAAHAEVVARDAVAAVGLDVSRLRRKVTCQSAAAMFGWPHGAEAKPMQTAARDAPVDRRLLVLESETGSGKTEAAFLRFKTLFDAGDVDALYFAVPTRAAAVQLHGRIDRAARALFGEEAVLAVPGYLRAGDAQGAPLPGWEVRWDDDPDEARRLARWAAETPRRFLAAPVAVGTVDQAMLSALTTKWAHFRAAALARTLLIVDEVHASDRFMTAIIERVVGDHVALGGHALLMSATLGSDARARWLCGRRASPPTLPEAEAAPYPLLSWTEGGKPGGRKLAHDGREKAVAMTLAPELTDAEAIARRAVAAASAGAKVLIIRNTVLQAQAAFLAVEALDPAAPLLTVKDVRAPHHSRFAPEDRKLLDGAVEQALGKDSPTAPVIVVGTQTLEQSLDISSDVLLTDLCPADVLLQRLGRLHRHRRPRPAGFDTPTCVVLAPERLTPDGVLARFGLGAFETGGVYENVVGLEATRRLVAERPVWRIPADNRLLVERATHMATLDALAEELGPEWRTAMDKLSGRAFARMAAAGNWMVNRDAAFTDPRVLFPDDEKILTRLGAEAVAVPLPEGTRGPFGADVSRLVLPLRQVGAIDPAAFEAAEVEAEPGGFRLRLGERRFRYGRTGVERIDAAC